MDATLERSRLPDRTLDQRMSALKKANDIRTARAKLKKNIQAGRVNAKTVLHEPPEYVLTMKVEDLLRSIPSHGKVKTSRILAACRISTAKTMGGLSPRQRAELLGRL